jgi:phosphoribosylformylglycinamidine synthase
MGQIVGCLEGMRDACLALDYPVISGNVSLYNETTIGDKVSAVQPTPAIGGVGILLDIEKRIGNQFIEENHHIILIGKTEGHLGSSLYLREVLGSEEGPAPTVDLTAECENGNFVSSLIPSSRLSACHDLSDGGLLVALAEMGFKHKIGATITFPENVNAHAFAFGEDQSRYLIATPQEHTKDILKEAASHNIPALLLGKTGGDALVIESLNFNEPITTLYDINEAWMPNYMDAK